MSRAGGYLKNAAVLTMAGLMLRAAGMLLRVFIAGQVGAEGMGLYQLVFTVYSLCSTFAISGISVAATRLAAEELARPGSENHLAGVMAKVIRLGLLLGFGAALVQFVTAVPVARYWLGDVRAVTALRLLAPSLPFMAVSEAMRGYFFAKQKVTPGVRVQLFEQLVRMSLIFVLLPKVAGKPIGIACAAVVIGNTVSEVLSCLLMVWYYSRDARSLPKSRAPAGTMARLWHIAAPVEGGKCLDSGFHTAENVMVPACLLAFLGDRKESLAQFGALKGMAMPLLLFPYSFLNPLSTLLLPEITKAHIQNSRERLEKLVGRVMLFTNVFSVLAGGLVCLHAGPVAEVLYHNKTVATYLMILGPVLPAMYLDSMGDAVLKGLGEEMATFRYSLWDSMLRIGLTLWLAPRYGMPGFLTVMLVSNLLSAILNIHRIHKVTHIPVRWYQWFVQPLLVFGIAAYTVFGFLRRFLEVGGLGFAILHCVATTLLYTLLLLPLGLANELAALKSSRKKK